jgi:hypothetical protein
MKTRLVAALPALLVVLVALVALVAAGCAHRAVAPSWKYADFKEVGFDPFPGMDFQGRDVKLSDDDVKGRVIWNLWTGDNASFWDWLSTHGFGTADLLKVVTSPRDRRFEKYGLFNQPGFMRPAQPDPYGLYVDVPREARYDLDSRIDTRTYGRSSGIMGLRLFPNPKFDAAAKAKWDPDRYFREPSYYNDQTLVRPYVVGMACSFCHLGADPTNPPANPDEAEYANLNDYVGQHFFKVWEVFGNDLGEDNFIWQLLHSNPPGTLDTSFIATDYLNNPGAMNGIFNVAGRLQVAVNEHVTGGALDLRNVHDPQLTPRVLKEGADSVGFTAALSRVYLNIGEYWEEWTRHFNPLVGLAKQSPIRVRDAQRLSPHWNWSEQHAPALAQYFLDVARPLKLATAPGGQKYLTGDEKVLRRGKLLFAQNCAHCHSSKQPPPPIQPSSPEGQTWFEQEVLKPDFFDGNFLSAEIRVPVTVVKTNAARSVASNAIRGHVWDNFSSETYKTLPRVGSIRVWDPFTGKDAPWEVPDGGRGYYRPPSLVAIWCSAPFFHNNALGKPVPAVDVDSRMAAFDDAIEKLLWPERRLGKDSIWRTTAESSIKIPKSYLAWAGELAEADGFIHVGPIPRGTPINLIANTNLEPRGLSQQADLVRLLHNTLTALRDVKQKGLTGDQATQRLLALVPDFYKLNSCPDFIEDEGHYFGTDLPDRDKRALIELVKTF